MNKKEILESEELVEWYKENGFPSLARVLEICIKEITKKK